MRLLKEKCSHNDGQNTELSKQLEEAKAKASAQRSRGNESVSKLEIAESRLQFFKHRLGAARTELREAKVKAKSYLKQLSYASWTRDIGWIRGIILYFETFRAWASDPNCNIDLNAVDTRDINPSEDAFAEIISLGHREMPYAEGIDTICHNPFKDFKESSSSGSVESSRSQDLKDAPNVDEVEVA